MSREYPKQSVYDTNDDAATVFSFEDMIFLEMAVSDEALELALTADQARALSRRLSEAADFVSPQLPYLRVSAS